MRIRGLIPRWLIQLGVVLLLDWIVGKTDQAAQKETTMSQIESSPVPAGVPVDSAPTPKEPSKFRQGIKKAMKMPWLALTLIVGFCLLWSLLVLLGITTFPWYWGENKANASAFTGLNMPGYDLSETLTVGFPPYGQLNRDADDYIIWVPNPAKSNDLIKVNKLTLKQDNFASGVSQPLNPNQRGNTKYDTVGYWEYLYANLPDGRVTFDAYNAPVHASGTLSSKSDIETYLKQVDVVQRPLRPRIVTTQPVGSSGTNRSSGSGWGRAD